MKQDIKRKVIKRLKIIEGQVRGLQRMVENEDYCIDILQQSMAMKQGISRVEDLMLENHLSTHIIDQIRTGREDTSIEEMLSIFKMSKRK